MTDPLTRALTHFNAEEYRQALLAFEERWHHERSDVLRALIQLSNALNQLRMGMITSPRQLLANAERLLEPSAEYEGIDLRPIQQYIGELRGRIPPEKQTGDPGIPWSETPRLRIDR